MKSFKLKRTQCPDCGSEDVRVVRSVGNYSRVAADVVLGFLLVPPFDYRLRCRRCGKLFVVAAADG